MLTQKLELSGSLAMTQAAIEALLKEKIGLDSLSIGSHTIARAVNQRMEDCGLKDIATYFYTLKTSPHELEELIERVVVSETWFFRDEEPFRFLGDQVISEWLPAHPREVLRVLSVPCATGEEPYSIAMALTQAGLPSSKFLIDAVDISKNALIKAQRAIYTRNSFRGKELAFRDHYFTRIADEVYQLNDSVKASVNFSKSNLLDPNFLAHKPAYDIIFCRNVLIYFDEGSRNQTVQTLERLLTPQGLLFAGHSEGGHIFAPWFTAVRHTRAFAYRKAPNQDASRSPLLLPKAGTTSSDALSASPSHSPAVAPVRSIPQSTTPNQKNEEVFGKPDRLLPISPLLKDNLRERLPLPPKATAAETRSCLSPPSPTPDLETAHRLADRGQLEEAAKICETYLRHNPTCTAAYVLLGQVHQATGKEEQAELFFQKAIYLQPNHGEALMHLALLKEHRGDIAGSTYIRQRIQRLQKFPHHP